MRMKEKEHNNVTIGNKLLPIVTQQNFELISSLQIRVPQQIFCNNRPAEKAFLR
jgi:hypothetical protein